VKVGMTIVHLSDTKGWFPKHQPILECLTYDQDTEEPETITRIPFKSSTLLSEFRLDYKKLEANLF
jgi:hypothetical protein